jgi:hypothetical protein
MASDTHALWRRWVWAFTTGELAGFSIPAIVGGLGFWLTRELDSVSRSLILYALAVPAGFAEGAVLAWFQARAVREHWPRLRTGRWVFATGLAAALAWACGMLAPTLDDVFGLSAAEQVAIWIPASLLILASIGGAQAWVLRGVVAGPGRWLVANVAGWLAGLPWTFVLPALLPDPVSVAVMVLTFVVAGTLMGLTAGAVTGAWVVRLDGYRP